MIPLERPQFLDTHAGYSVCMRWNMSVRWIMRTRCEINWLRIVSIARFSLGA